MVHSAHCAALRHRQDFPYARVGAQGDGEELATDEAAPQAAGGTGTEDIARVLDVLRLLWDDEYLIGHDDGLGWWASRRGVIGHIITARSPDELGRLIGDDFGPGR
jgi:hypothetical protein